MTKDNWKQVIISVLIGACVAFFSTLFQGLLDFLSNHSQDIVAGGVSSLTYMARTLKYS